MSEETLQDSSPLLPVGQREVNHGTEFTDEEINFIESHGFTVADIRGHLESVGAKSLETAIGSLVAQGVEASPAVEESAEEGTESVTVTEPEAPASPSDVEAL